MRFVNTRNLIKQTITKFSYCTIDVKVERDLEVSIHHYVLCGLHLEKFSCPMQLVVWGCLLKMFRYL